MSFLLVVFNYKSLLNRILNEKRVILLNYFALDD